MCYSIIHTGLLESIPEKYRQGLHWDNLIIRVYFTINYEYNYNPSCNGNGYYLQGNG